MVISAATIKARVIATGAIVLVDDAPIHNDTEGRVWHDDDLEFLEERLQ